MKIRIGTRAALIAGLCAWAVRLAQYFFGLDAEGFLLPGALAKGLMIALIALTLGGILLAVIGSFEKDVPEAGYDTLFKKTPAIRLLFILLAVVAAGQSVLQLTSRKRENLIFALILFLGAIGWLMVSRAGARGGLFALLPLLQLGAATILCFWSTYKFIHISENNLLLLGYCAELLPAMMLMKVFSGSAVSQRKLARSLSYALILLPAAFFAPLVSFRLSLILPAAQAFLIWLIALIAIFRLPAPAPEVPVVAPDPEDLDQMIGDLPDPDDDEDPPAAE